MEAGEKQRWGISAGQLMGAVWFKWRDFTSMMTGMRLEQFNSIDRRTDWDTAEWDWDTVECDWDTAECDWDTLEWDWDTVEWDWDTVEWDAAWTELYAI